MTKRDAAIGAAMADSIALKLACHDPKSSPQADAGQSAGARRVRGGRTGPRRGYRSRRMAGVAKNLTAMLDDHFHRGKFDEITDRADAPLFGCAGDAGARALDRHGSAHGGEKMVDSALLEDRRSRCLGRPVEPASLERPSCHSASVRLRRLDHLLARRGRAIRSSAAHDSIASASDSGASARSVISSNLPRWK